MQVVQRTIIHPDSATLAAGIAARMATTIMDILSEQRTAHIVVTGGRSGIGGIAALSQEPLLAAVDFSRVHIWWGDERFLPADHPDRNDVQAKIAMAGAVAIPPTHLHPMPVAEEGLGVARAARDYADELAAWSASDDGLPAFDLVLLGIGPDGHVASLFPYHPAVSPGGPAVVGVREAPKPPAERISLSASALSSARQVWLLAAGFEKVDAVRAAWLAGPDLEACPASAVRGRATTLLLADAAAASGLGRPY